MEKTTITVDEDTLQRFNRLKTESTDANMPEQSANLFLQSLLDTWDSVDQYQEQGQADVLEDISEQLSGLDGQQQTLDGKREIIKRIEDLENEITMQLERLQQ